MSSDARYSAFLEHQNAIGQAYCAQAVCDDDGSVVPLQFHEVAVDAVHQVQRAQQQALARREAGPGVAGKVAVVRRHAGGRLMIAQTNFALRGCNPDMLTCITNLSNDDGNIWFQCIKHS